MARALATWLAATALGAALVAWLPEGDSAVPLFRLSAGHGPSAADMLGLLVLLAGWTFWIASLVRLRRDMAPRWFAIVLIVASVLATAAAVGAFAADHDRPGYALAAAAFAAQAGLGWTIRGSDALPGRRGS